MPTVTGPRLKDSIRPALIFLACLFIAVAACSAPPAENTPDPGPALAATAWRRLGPGGGGAMFLPTVDPVNPDNVYLRCDMTGAYVTHDGGKAWRMFNLRAVVRDFEFDPSDPKVAYASNTGLYRTEDGGASWRIIYPDSVSIVAERMVGDHAEQYFETADGPLPGEIVKVRVDPKDGRHIYLGLTASEQGAEAKARVLVSTDRGASWRELARVSGSTVLAIIPGAWDGFPDEVTVVTDRSVARIKESGGGVKEQPLPGVRAAHADAGAGPRGSVIYALISASPRPGYLPSGEEIYRSEDRGNSWHKVMQGLLPKVAAAGKAPVFSTLAVCENSPGVAYLSCNRYWPEDGGKRQFGIFKSTDSGESWHWVFRADSDSMLTGKYDGGWLMDEYGPEWGENPFSIGVAPGNPDIAYASDFGCTYRTVDGGRNWEQVYTDRQADGTWVSRGLDVTVCYGVQFDPFDRQHLFANYTDIGALQSFNGGESWSHATRGIPHPWINGCYWTVFDPQVKDRAWSVWSEAHDLPRPKMFRSGHFDRYSGGAAVSADGGRTWKVSNAGLPENCPSTFIVLDPDSPVDARTLYLCGFGRGVFKSVDGGASWRECGEIPGPNKNVWKLARLKSGRLILLVARGLANGQTLDGGMFASGDGGSSWQPLALPAGVNAPNDLAPDPSDPDRMFVALWPRTEDGREVGGGVLLTEDGGKSWSTVFREDAHVYSVAVAPEDPARVYINTFDSAAFTSADGGRSWNRIRGYDFKWGHRVIPDPLNPGMIYLTTFGGGLFHGSGLGDPQAAPEIVNLSQAWRWGL